MHRFTYGFALLGVLSGCGGENSSASRSTALDLGSYVEESCEFGVEDGAGAPSSKALRAHRISGPFEKIYDSTALKAIAQLSIRETLAFIEKSGVRVYRTAALSEQSCKPFASLPAAPGDLQLQWDTNDLGVSRYEGESRFLSGLYLPKDSAILVREDANRWTLVHEFLHHLLRVESIAAGYDDARWQKSRLETLEQMRVVRDDSNLSPRQKAERITPLFLRFVEINDRLLVEYPLEEIAVESILHARYAAEELQFVPEKAHAKSIRSLERSRRSVRHFYRALDQMYLELRQVTTENKMDAEYRQLERYPVLKAKRLAQVEKMLAGLPGETAEARD